MTNAELLNECGTKLSAMDAHLGAATERLGVGDTVRAKVEVSAAHALLGPAGAALAAVAASVLGTPPVEPPQPVPGKPPGPMLPGQLTIEQCTTADKLFMSNANPSIVDLAKLYASDVDIARMYAEYVPGGSGWPAAGYNPATYTGPFRR